MATTRLKQERIEGPDGRVLKVNWMPGNRIRLDLTGYGAVTVAKVFPNPSGDITRVELNCEK